MGKNVNTPFMDVHLDKHSSLCAPSFTRASCPSQSEVWGFLFWGVCSCTSHLFGIPQLSSLHLPCFRPCAWLTCPSSSELLNTPPPWNHQLQSSDLPGPVCFSMKLPPGSLTIHLCLMHLQCRVVVSLPPQDVPHQYRCSWVLWSAGSWSRKGRLPRHHAVSPLFPLQRSPPRVHVVPTSIWSSSSSCPRRRRCAVMPSQLFEIHICDKADFGVGGGGRLMDKHI